LFCFIDPFAAIGMKAEIPITSVDRTNVEQVNVGEVKVGPVAIERLVLSDVNVQTSTGIAQIRGVFIDNDDVLA
jgi:hypothetical protein